MMLKPHSVSGVFRKAALGSTVRGLRKVVAEPTLQWKIIWFVTVSIFFVIAIYTASAAIVEYLKYPVKTVEIINQHIDIELPAISFCQPGVLLQGDINNFVNEVSSVSNTTLVNLVETLKQTKEAKWIKFSTIAEILTRSFYKKNNVSVQTEDNLINCRLRHFVHISKMDYHNCSGTRWIPDNDCMTVIPPAPKRKPFGSQYYSFIVFLNNFNDSKPNLYSNSSFFVKHGLYYMVHDRDYNMPNLGYFLGNSFYAVPGSEVTANVQLRTHAYLNEPYGSCNSSGSTQNYTRCVRECLTRNIASQCKCIDREMSFFPDFVLDEFNKQEYNSTLPDCYHLDSNVKHMSSELNCVLSKQNEQRFLCRNECQEVCYKKKFTLSYTSENWPSIEDTVEIIEDIKLDDDFKYKNRVLKTLGDLKSAQHNFIKFQVNFNYENIRQFKDEPEYTLWKLASNLGGAMSLWLGLTLMAAVEIVELIYDMCVLFYNKRKTKKEEDRNDNNIAM